MRRVRILLGGLGNACRPLLALLTGERERAAKTWGLEFQLVGAADSGGAVLAPDGISPERLAAVKEAGKSVGTIPTLGRAGMTARELLEQSGADIYVEATPAGLPSGEPGTANILTALERGMHVVAANKAPLALHWGELFARAEERGLTIRYGAAAGVGLPVLEMGRMLGRCGELRSFTGVFSASCMYIIREMERGRSRTEALDAARKGGFLEADPAMDLEGWDVAMKTVLLANTFWDRAYTLADVEIEGIGKLSGAELSAAAARGEVLRMLGRAEERKGGGLTLHAGPVCLPGQDPLAGVLWQDKAIVMDTRTQGRQVHYGLGASSAGTAGAVYGDLVTVAREL